MGIFSGITAGLGYSEWARFRAECRADFRAEWRTVELFPDRHSRIENYPQPGHLALPAQCGADGWCWWTGPRFDCVVIWRVDERISLWRVWRPVYRPLVRRPGCDPALPRAFSALAGRLTALASGPVPRLRSRRTQLPAKSGRRLYIRPPLPAGTLRGDGGRDGLRQTAD